MNTVNNQEESFILTLNKKDTLGLYISLTKCDSYLNDSSRRILQKIEKYLYDRLTIDQFAHIEDFYLKMPYRNEEK